MCSRSGIVGILCNALILQSCVNHDLLKQADCAQSDLTVMIDSVSEATSCSIADGRIYASAKGGKEPYRFILNAGLPRQSPIFTDQSSGIYTITVRDDNGCESSLDNITVLAEDFKFSADVAEDNNCLNHDGAIAIHVNAGTPPFSYKLNNEVFSDLNSFTGLQAGQYAVTIKDSIDCTVQLTITVPRGTTGTSWSIDILPIMKASCALNGCHDGKTRFDYKDYQTVKQYASSIESMTKDGRMPFDGPPLPQSQVALIACWVEDGAVEN